MPPVPASRRSAPPPPSNNPSSSTASYADVSELDKYQLDSNIGKGSFGVISKVIRKSDGKEFAMKQIDYGKMTDKDKKQIMAEVAILESLKHRNIVQLVQKIRDRQKERIYIVMEYCTSGDLGTLIRRAQRTNTPMNEDKIWNIFLQITLALNHCHWPSERSSEQNGRLGSRLSGAGEEGASGRCQVLHRDLKPENVFMSEDFVKLGDFGLSKDMGSASFTSTYVGTPLYMPPEILAENRYDTKSDIWSLGCLVFEMCVLSSPFSAATTQPQLIGLVRSGKLPEIPVQYSRSLRGIIRTMLSLDPAKRPTTKDLLELPEMKMHKKVFTLQNQTLLLLSRKEEVKRLEDTLRARSAQLDARERSLVMREQACLVREKEADETNAKMAAAAEQMRAQWDQLNKERHEYETAYREAEARLGQRQAEIDNARAALQPVRPPLEERATLPMASSSRPRAILAGYENTPTKIPLPSAAPVSLRKHASKSLGNLAAIARGDIGPSQHPSFPGNIYDNPIDVDRTPAKQLAGQGGSSIRSRKDRFGRNSIGSPSDLKKRYSGIYGAEDVTMASAYGCRFGSPAVAGTSTGSFDLAGADNSAMASPFMLKAGISRPRKSSLVGPGGISGTRQQTGAGGGTQTPAEVLAQQRQQIQAPAPISAPTSTGSGASSSSYVPSAGAGSTHVHAMATPAKWTPDDPDLPSPFLRRMTTAPATIPTVPSVPASTAPLYPTIPSTSTEDRHSAPAYTARTRDRPERERERASERAALGAIPLPSQIGHTSSAASSVESKSEKATSTYEIGAGIAKMGIRHKGSAPPAPGTTMGGIPRSKSGNLHQYATMRAAREDGARVVGGTAGTGDVRREGQGTGSLGYARNRAIGRG